MNSNQNPGAFPSPAQRRSLKPGSRRSFLAAIGLGSASLALAESLAAQEKVIQGFERSAVDPYDSSGLVTSSHQKQTLCAATLDKVSLTPAR